MQTSAEYGLSGVTKTVCTECKKMFEGWQPQDIYPSRTQRIFTRNNDAVRQSSAKGECSICYDLAQTLLVIKSMEHEQGVENNREITVIEAVIVNTGNFSHIDLELPFGRRLFYQMIKIESGSLMGSYMPRDGSTFSTQAMSLARHWLGTCSVHHDLCSNHLKEPETWYPTRLIGVGSNKGSVENIRLCLPDREPVSGKYCTLSHCWGSVVFMTLTRSNLMDFQRQIPYETLPRTFREAILVARELEIRYLWIDSLCILQDDLADWIIESKTMRDVYSRAFCNIGSAWADNSTEGLFNSRDPSSICFPTLYMSWPNTKQDLTVGNYAIVRHDIVDQKLTKLPLFLRSWVFQERILCKRMIHFCEDQLFWECNEETLCESYPCGSGLSRLYSHRKQDLIKCIGSDWLAMAAEYSKTRLTRESDLFPALSGIAEQHCQKAKLSPNDYIAGIWKQNLLQGLAWRAYLDAAVSGRRLPYAAPSWSWGSTKHEVHFYSFSKAFRPLMSVTESYVSLNTSNPFGSIDHAHLKVRGSLVEMRWSPGAWYNAGISDKSGKTGSWHPDDAPPADKAGACLCLPIVMNNYVEGSGKHWTIEGLVVEKSGDNYKRTGYFLMLCEEDTALTGTRTDLTLI